MPVRLVIKGGLGNQMFQYAAAYSLAKKLGTTVIVDLSFIQNRLPIPGFSVRKYELAKVFGLKIPTTTFFKSSLLNRYLSYPVQLLVNRIGLQKSYIRSDPFRVLDVYGFDEKFFNLEDGVTVEGEFNNYRYFVDYDKEVRDMYDTDKLYEEGYEDIEKSIKDSNSVFVHIRRGDYLNEKHRDLFVYLDTDYYRKAISEVKKNAQNPHFYIFSIDDPDGFKSILGLDKSEYTYVGKEYVGDQFKTYLRLMSLCKHGIISNSTFSFWGAYLSKNKDKVVVAPRKWTRRDSDFDAPKNWVTI